MNPAQAMWLCVMAGAFVGLVVGWWVGGLVYQRARATDERLKEIGWAARKAEHEGALEVFGAEVSRLRELYQEECRKREEQFRMIEGIQKERDGWKDIFWQCSSEHGVAQEYMVRINQHFAKICGKHPDARMSAIRKAFEEKYGEAAKPRIAVRIEQGLAGLPGPGAEHGTAETAVSEPVIVAKEEPNA